MTFENRKRKTAVTERVLERVRASALLILLLFPAVVTLAQSGGDQELKYRYLNLPPDLQAQHALVKLDRAIQAGGSQSKLLHLNQGRRWLTEAIARYGEYTSPPNQTYPTTNRTAQSIDPAASPFGLLTHLWRAKEGMIQHRATSQLYEVPPELTPEMLKAQENAIQDAIEAMRKAVSEVEASRGWTVHSDGMFLSLQVPPGFEAGQNSAYRLYLAWRPAKGSRVEKAVFVSVMPNKDNLQPYEHQARAVTRERGEHADMVVIENSRGLLGVPGSQFTYGYTWGNMELQGVIHHFNHNNNMWEIKYLSVTNRFDEEECEGIIRSVIRK
ncbi:hypothetical protein ACFLT2_14540 [Acidobacteriota bacterium]